MSELALLRYLISKATTGLANDIALLALSRIIIRVSNQDSETRYVSRDKGIQKGYTLRTFLDALSSVVAKVGKNTRFMQYSAAEFVTADTRFHVEKHLPPESIGLIVTSPPYPNATDYHLYHRFRLFWLGFDPKTLADVEIGSHLKHQRQNSGFDDYCDDMRRSLSALYTALQSGRYAALVVGDAVFNGEVYSTAEAIARIGKDCGYEICSITSRKIHDTKRSFSQPARRARNEQIVILRKPDKKFHVSLTPPNYKMWAYEAVLREREIEAVLGKVLAKGKHGGSNTGYKLGHEGIAQAGKLTFTTEVIVEGCSSKSTWQKVLENGSTDPSRRKDPKYATHGVHAYKGKFYPQLAKALINTASLSLGSKVLDPFCGSGTVPLECFLNGYRAYGVDMNPLAAKIASAKTGIFTVDIHLVKNAFDSLLEIIKSKPKITGKSLSSFPPVIHDELLNWFPAPVLHKLNWLLAQIRLFGNKEIVSFLEVIASTIIRDVSHQDPSDLRIRRRSVPLEDADVLERFSEKLEEQYIRIQKYWSITGRKPYPTYVPAIIHGDCRSLDAYASLLIEPSSIDLVVTSPPYATALPYIDTDRLSLMAIMGIPSNERTAYERELTGSREIGLVEKRKFEEVLFSKEAVSYLPEKIVLTLRHIHTTNQKNGAGFRRTNMAALLWRYFADMKKNLENVHRALKPNAFAYYVVGNSQTKLGDEWFEIETCGYLSEIAASVGFGTEDYLNISVTTEHMKHVKNAITENVILRFTKKTKR